jgi:WD40 repeat protein
MTQLFISHSSKNNAEALALSQWLTAEGWDAPFLDFEAQHGIALGDDWKEQLRLALGRCKGFIALVSPDWLRSDWCQREFAVARHLTQAKVFALLLHDTKKTDLPEGFSSRWQVVSLTDGADQELFTIELPRSARSYSVGFSRHALQSLAVGLKRAGIHPELFPWPPPKDPNRVPYRGLAALEADDAGIFFSREAPIADLLAQLRGLREAAPPRFLAILGASGAGKSSFLRAGILPRLARDDRHFLPLPVIRPERAVLTGSKGLVECLWTVRRECKLNWSRPQIEAAVATGAPALQILLQQLAEHCQVPDWDGSQPQPPTLVLAIDQAEELFQAEGAVQAGRFLSLLAELLQADTPKLIVLCTIRSDSYEPLQTAPALADITQRVFSLPPMPHGAFRQVIEAPVALLKHSPRPLRIEPQLTEALLRDIAEGGAKDALPLLAFTLERLYVDYSTDGFLSLKDYQDLGRIAGAIEKAVDAALDQAQRNPKLPNDRDECLKLLRRGLIPWMAGIDRHSNLPYRKVAPLSQVPPESRALIEHFVDYRLLATDKNPQGETTIEPAHEALLRQWTKLRNWLLEEAAPLATLESVKAASRDWDANRRRSEWLTHAAGRLEDAEALHQRADLAANLDWVDRLYLGECRTLENEQRDREASKLAQAQMARRDQLRTKSFAALLFFLLVGMLFLFRQESEQRERAQAAEARMQVLVAQSSERARQQARMQLEDNDESGALAHFADSLGFLETYIAREESALILQRLRSPTLFYASDEVGIPWSFNSQGSMLAFSKLNLKDFQDTGELALSVQVWDAKKGTPASEPLLNETQVSFVEFSIDGKRLVAVSGKVARVWDLLRRELPGVSLVDNGKIESAAFSHDGTRVVTAGADGVARIWNATTGLLEVDEIRHDQPLAIAVFSPDGSKIMTASGRSVRLWDSSKGTALGEPLHHDSKVIYAAFSPDGERIISSEGWGASRLWNARTKSRIGSLMNIDSVPTYAIGVTKLAEVAHLKFAEPSFSPDGVRVITALGNGAQVWESATARAIGDSIIHENFVQFASFSPDGRRVVTIDWLGTVRTWDSSTLVEIGKPLESFYSPASAAISSDGAQIAIATDSGSLLTHSLRNVMPSLSVRTLSHSSMAAFSHDGRRIAIAGETAQIWSLQNGMALGAQFHHDDWVRFVAFSQDDTRLVSASLDGTARIWDVLNRAAIGAPLKHEGSVNTAAFSPDGTLVVTASADNTARVWDVRSGVAIGARLKHDGEVNSAVFSPDGSRVVTTSADATARVWDTQRGEEIGAPLKHEGSVNMAAFSPDGARVVTASDDATARIWDVQSGAAIGTPFKHESDVKSAIFSPDGAWVVTASWDTTRIWEVRSGTVIALIKDPGLVNSASFSPDGMRVAAATSDGTVKIWDVQTTKMLGTPVEPDDLIALSGRRVADNGRLEWLSGPEWMALIKKVRAKAEKGITKKDQLMRWHFADPATRAISPFSQITVPQHIEREIDWVLEHPQTEKSDGPNYSPRILDEAYNLDPGHPLILLALSVFEDRPETKALWKRLSFPRFEKDARLAARAAEILLIDKDPENARKAAEMALKLPSATEADRAKAQVVIERIEKGNRYDG